jgi:O-antigen/teichoic acid export membrane protein
MDQEIPTSRSSLKTEFSINIIARLFFIVLSVGVGIWIVPYLVKHIGIAAFGLIPLATSITQYINLATASIQAGISRYLTVDIQQDNPASANKTFNTAFFLITAILLLLIPLALLFSFHIPGVFDVPIDLENSARWLFIAIILMFMVDTLKGIFGASPFALNLIYLNDGIRAASLVLRVALIIILFELISPRLWLVGFSYLGGAVLTLFLSVLVWKKTTPQLKISLRSFDRPRMHDLAFTGGWIFIDQIGTVLLLSIDLILINKLFGSKSGGEYALILQWAVLLRTMAAVVSNMLKPIIYKYYAQSQQDRIIKVSKLAVKLLGIGAALPIGLVCGFAHPLLSIWVGPEYSKLAPLMWILVGHWCLNISILPLFSIQVAYNKVKLPGIVTFLAGIANIGLALLLSITLGWKMYGVAAASAIILTLRHLGFTPWYCSRILKQPNNIFLRSILYGTTAAGCLGLVSRWVGNNLNPANWIELILCGSLISIIYLLISFFGLLKPDERKYILSFIPSKTIR